jgi:hypothetical protein
MFCTDHRKVLFLESDWLDDFVRTNRKVRNLASSFGGLAFAGRCWPHHEPIDLGVDLTT